MTQFLDRAHYRETVDSLGTGEERLIQSEYGVQSYAGIILEVRPLAAGSGVKIEWNAGASFPSRFAAAALQGIHDTIQAGVRAGCELTDVLISVEDGSYHEEDSNDNAFRHAARKALARAVEQAQPVVLEAISRFRAVFPSEYAGAISGLFPGSQLEALQKDEKDSSIDVFIPTAAAGTALQKILSATGGSTKIAIEGAGFRPMREPPETSAVWVPVKT